MDNKQLIASDISKKQKVFIAQRKYRERLKAGTAGKDGTETTYDTYKKSNADYMRRYRAEKKVLRSRLTPRQILNLKPRPKRKSQKYKNKYQSQNNVDLGEKANKLICQFKLKGQ